MHDRCCDFDTKSTTKLVLGRVSVQARSRNRKFEVSRFSGLMNWSGIISYFNTSFFYTKVRPLRTPFYIAFSLCYILPEF